MVLICVRYAQIEHIFNEPLGEHHILRASAVLLIPHKCLHFPIERLPKTVILTDSDVENHYTEFGKTGI